MGLPRRQSQWLSQAGVSTVMLLFAISGQAQTDVNLKAIGGGGGGPFIPRCPQGQFLAGVDLRTGDDVDAIRPLCATVSARYEVGPLVPGGIWFGGDGGGPRQLVCPRATPIVFGMHIRAQGVATVVVNGLTLDCGMFGTAKNASVEWEGPDHNYERRHPGKTFAGLPPIGGKPKEVPEIYLWESCIAGGLMAVGLNGRSGVWLDAAGLICGEPKLPPPTKRGGQSGRQGKDDVGRLDAWPTCIYLRACTRSSCAKLTCRARPGSPMPRRWRRW